jgi:hypothetical protein
VRVVLGRLGGVGIEYSVNRRIWVLEGRVADQRGLGQARSMLVRMGWVEIVQQGWEWDLAVLMHEVGAFVRGLVEVALLGEKCALEGFR